MGEARQNLDNQIIERAARDPRFREQLKQDPRGTLARDLGVQLSPDVTVEVVEETPSTVYLVLPDAPAERGEELADQDLDAAAGGADSYATACGGGTCGTCWGCPPNGEEPLPRPA